MKYPVLPALSFISAFLTLIPLPWHWRARNAATLSLMGWLFVNNLIFGINSVVWADNVRDVLRIWCDITSTISLGAGFAIPLATVCICKHLEMVSSTRNVRFDIRDRRRRMIFELVMCFLVPVVFMALHYIVQGHRYDIVENMGCQATTYVSIPAIFLVYVPPLACAAATLVYAGLALRHFIRRRLTFSSHLQQRSSALTTSRYLRLIAMSVTIMLWSAVTIPINLAINVTVSLRPWTNWDDVHSNWNRVDQYPELLLPTSYYKQMMFIWLVTPVTGLVFFAFFGWGEEAKKEYAKIFAKTKDLWQRVFRRDACPDDKHDLPSYRRSVPRTLRLSALRTIDIKGSGSVTADSVTFADVGSPAKSHFTVAVGAEYDISLSPRAYKVVREWEEKQEAVRAAYYSSHSRQSLRSTEGNVPVEEIEISDAHSDPSVQFSDDFKPLPPLPSFPSPPPHGMSRPYSSSTLTSGSAPSPLFPPALRHAASAPDMPVPLFHSTTLDHGIIVTVETLTHRV